MRYQPTYLAAAPLVLGFCLGLTGCAKPPSRTAARGTAAGHGQLPRRARGHRLRGLHGPDGRGRFRRAAGPRLGLPGQGQLQGRGAGQERGRALRDRPAHLPGGLEERRGQPRAAEARAERLDADLGGARISRQGRDQPGGVGQDRRRPRRGGGVDIAAAKAASGTGRLDLGFTKVTAPVSGRVSRYHVTVGNLVQAGDLTGGTLLTTIVSVDPMYAYFDVDERTVLRVKQLIREGKAKTPDDVEIPVWLGLANEDGHPHRGPSISSTTRSTPKTGTLKVRGVFPNKDEALSPGYFARVRVPIGGPHKALLVTERRWTPTRGRRSSTSWTRTTRWPPGPSASGLHDGLREITDGLKPGERVIVNGLQQVRPGMTVEPNLVDMPTSKAGRRAGNGPAKVAPKP